MALKQTLFALLVTATVFAISLFAQPVMFQTWTGTLLDAAARGLGSKEAPDGVAIIALDDTALGAIGPHQDARGLIAEMVNAAHQAGARRIALDYLFVGESPHDAALARAIETAGSVVLAVAPNGGTAPPSETLRLALARSAIGPQVSVLNGSRALPLGPIDDFARWAHLGHVSIQPDADGVMRRVTPLGTIGGFGIPALPFAVTETEAGEQTQRLSFFGPEGGIRTYTAKDMRQGQADLADQVVFVGTTAIGFGDRYATPFDRQMPGVEILATAAANALAQSFLDDGPRAFLISLASALVLAALVALGIQSKTSVFSMGLPALCFVSAAGLCLVALQLSFALFMSEVALSLILTGGLSAAFRVQSERRAASNLERFTSPGLRGTLRTHGGLDHVSEEIDAAAVCIDVVGFTERSVNMNASDTAAFLQKVHETVENAVLPHGGVVEHFTGDGIMIIFGLTKHPTEPAQAAMDAINRFETEEDALNALFASQDKPRVETRVTAHAGRALPSILGGKEQGHVTLTGPVLTGAARLQEIAKTLEARVLVSDALSSVDRELVDYGPQVVRGWKEKLHCFGIPREASVSP